MLMIISNESIISKILCILLREDGHDLHELNI